MAEQTVDEPPNGQGGRGDQKAEPESEVGGRVRRRQLYTCFKDGAQNYVYLLDRLMCWQCSGVTYLN